MTQRQYIINRKLNIMELGATLGNISEACRKLGISRQHYYDIKTAIEEEGLEGLLEKSRRSPRIGNRVAPEIEQKVLDYFLEFPTHGQTRAANELKKRGPIISAGGVRSIWLRHNLQTKGLRLKRLEQWAAETANILTESQVQAQGADAAVDCQRSYRASCGKRPCDRILVCDQTLSPLPLLWWSIRLVRLWFRRLVFFDIGESDDSTPALPAEQESSW